MVVGRMVVPLWMVLLLRPFPCDKGMLGLTLPYFHLVGPLFEVVCLLMFHRDESGDLSKCAKTY